MKAWIRDNREALLAKMAVTDKAAAYSLLWEAVLTAMTPQNICGWYRDSGYVR